MNRTDSGSASRLPSSLLAAWRAARYEVTAARPPFVLHVDEPSDALAACHLEHGVCCSAFVTAWNPGGRPVATEANLAAEAMLEERLRARGYWWLGGRCIDPAGAWPPEPSVLILGLDRDAAAALAREAGQAGLVCAAADAVPRLVLLA